MRRGVLVVDALRRLVLSCIFLWERRVAINVGRGGEDDVARSGGVGRFETRRRHSPKEDCSDELSDVDEEEEEKEEVCGGCVGRRVGGRGFGGWGDEEVGGGVGRWAGVAGEVDLGGRVEKETGEGLSEGCGCRFHLKKSRRGGRWTNRVSPRVEEGRKSANSPTCARRAPSIPSPSPRDRARPAPTAALRTRVPLRRKPSRGLANESGRRGGRARRSTRA